MSDETRGSTTAASASYTRPAPRDLNSPRVPIGTEARSSLGTLALAHTRDRSVTWNKSISGVAYVPTETFRAVTTPPPE